jgi:hypothetical protein
MERWAAVARLSLVLMFGLSLLKCHQVLFTAPPGTTMNLIANPEFIPANGGISVISALLILPSGAPVADGTVVQFFTNLGRVDAQVRTNDGVARANLVSDSRSGTATVTAFSGGGAVGTISTPSSSITVSTSLVSAPVFAAAQQVSASVPVRIGNILPTKLVVTAFPPSLSDKRAALITANVLDSSGNPVANVPIIFSVTVKTGGLPLTEFMDSQGTPTFTDNNGQAFDVLRTRWPADSPEKTVTVRADAPTGALNGTVDVVINPGISSPTPGSTTTTTTTTTLTAAPASVTIDAVPPSIDAPPRTSTITATVLDGSGNPFPNAQVRFTVAFLSGTGVLNESLASMGAAVITDGTGHATDTLSTTDVQGTNIRTDTLTATVTGGTNPTNSRNIQITVP